MSDSFFMSVKTKKTLSIYLTKVIRRAILYLLQIIHWQMLAYSTGIWYTNLSI